jgi:zinc transport system substrate-binding protein
MNWKGIRLLAVLLISILAVAGCGRAAGNGNAQGGNEGTGSAVDAGNPAASAGGELNIVTSFYPVYVATINVVRDIPGVTVKNMTKPQTGCLHDYSLKPEDLKTLEKADIFVINGAGMEAFLDEVISRQENLEIIEASRGIDLIKDGNGEENPHVWVGISNAITYVNNIASRLAELDSSNADKYAANAAAYVRKLELLKSDMHDAIDALPKKDIITFHEAFPYFAQEFHLRIVAVIEREPDTEPTPRELGEIIDTVNASGIRALFAEPQYSSKAADAIARETGAKVYSLDPVVTGEAGADSYDAYINAMEKNKQTLLEALK